MGIEIDGVNNKIDLDDDKDTSISSASDDTLVVEVGGNTLATLTENKFTINDNLTVTTADTTDTLILQSTDAGASAGPHLILDRGSASPAADDLLGRISYRSRNSAGEQIDLIKTSCFISDATDGSEDTQFEIDQRIAGTFRNMLTMFASGIVFNEDSQDIDFRVETNGETHTLFVDGGNDLVNVGGVGSTSALTTPRHTLFAGGQQYYFTSSNSATDVNRFYNSDSGALIGKITMSSSATAFVTSSDYRLKENIDYEWNATDRLKLLKPCQFSWKVDQDETLVDGFLAHEVEEIVPEAVSGEKDAMTEDGEINPQGIDHSKLVPLLVKTIEELEARITELENA